MLVLHRKESQRIMIGDDIIITIVQAGPGTTVRVGIEAPRGVPVLREELYLKGKADENRRRATETNSEGAPTEGITTTTGDNKSS